MVFLKAYYKTIDYITVKLVDILSSFRKKTASLRVGIAQNFFKSDKKEYLVSFSLSVRFGTLNCFEFQTYYHVRGAEKKRLITVFNIC